MKRRRVIFELILTALVALDLALLGYEVWGKPTHEQVFWIEHFDLALALLFLTEFLVLMVYSRRPIRYLRGNWPMLVASIPVAVPGTQLIRLLRLVRLADHIVWLVKEGRRA